jgi:hypothetical protein
MVCDFLYGKATLLLLASQLVVWSLQAQALVGAGKEAPDLEAHVVMVLKRSGNRAGFCSATVISRNTVLTAAHCIADLADTRVHFRDVLKHPVLREVAEIAIHPGFLADAVEKRRRSIDLALLRLAEPLPESFIPITLDGTNRLEVDQTLRLAGFGVATEGDAKTSGILRSGIIAVREPLSSILLWASDPQNQGTGACTGDSGGPVLRVDRAVLVAVSVWAEGKGRNRCGLLTQAVLVGPQRIWIETLLKKWSMM